MEVELTVMPPEGLLLIPQKKEKEQATILGLCMKCSHFISEHGQIQHWKSDKTDNRRFFAVTVLWLVSGQALHASPEQGGLAYSPTILRVRGAW